MTFSPNQPIGSGAPTPVQGVTGGPPVLAGQIQNDPNDGSVVVSPNPGNVFQIRKGASPQALQIYEFFNASNNFARLAFNATLGGPFQIRVESTPTVNRDLVINGSGTGVVQIPSLRSATAVDFTGAVVNPNLTQLTANGSSTTLTTGGVWTDITGSTITPTVTGLYLVFVFGNWNNTAGAAQARVQVAAVPTNSGGGTGLANVIVPGNVAVVANATETLTAMGFATLTSGVSYIAQAFSNVVGATGIFNVRAIRIA